MALCGEGSVSWGKFAAAGIEYDLTHLDPFVLRVRPSSPGAPIFAVRVQFGAHCFTKKSSQIDSADFRFMDGGKERCFCPIRHERSLDLPSIVKNARSGFAYTSQRQNYLLVKPDENATPYAVFFDLKAVRSGKYDAVMSVVSAYLKPNLATQLPSIPFTALIARTARGQAIKPGPLRKW